MEKEKVLDKLNQQPRGGDPVPDESAQNPLMSSFA